MRALPRGTWLVFAFFSGAFVAACDANGAGDPAPGAGTGASGWAGSAAATGGTVAGTGAGAAGTGGAGYAGAGAGGSGGEATGGAGGTSGVGGSKGTGGELMDGGAIGPDGGSAGFGASGGAGGAAGASGAGGTFGIGGNGGTGGTGGQPYKGVANSPANELAELGATWCYNWGTSPQASDCGDPLFVPMIWGAGDVAGAIQQIGNAGYDTVLAFNEPNKPDQANMTVAQAIALWPDMTSDPNIRVSSPAVSDDGRAWLEDFMAQALAGGLRVDFIAMHWYGWNAGSCVPGQLEGAINWASQWGLPIWITEFGCMGSSNTDEATVLNFFNDMLAMLDRHPLVERYAWYPWNTYNHLYLPNASDVRVITPLGEALAAAPAYR